jgi:hypothetical protein
MDFRTSTALALLPNPKGPAYFASLSTGRIICRDQFKIVTNVPQEYLVILKALQERGVFAIEGSGPHVPIDLSKDPETAPAEAPRNVDQEEILFSRVLSTTTTTSNPVSEKRPNVDLNHLDINQSIRIHGKEATMKALDAELQNMIDKEAFVPISVEDAANIDKDSIIPSSVFFKGKELPNGFIEVKGRLVAGGHRQIRELYPSDSSPTVSPATIFILVVYAAENFWMAATMDVKAAYLNASRHGQRALYVRIRGILATRYLEIVRERYGLACIDCLDPKTNSFLALLDKALYGTLEAANLWYQEVTTTMTRLGFKVSEEDPCLFLKHGIKVALYVDDFLVVAKLQEDIEDLHSALVELYSEVKITKGNDLKFLGMNLKFVETSVEIKIDLHDILVNVDGSSTHPTGMNLFHRNEDSPLLDRVEQASFHSMVAKLLYVSKRTRPDILLPVNFLCTRVQSPTVEDQAKLTKVLKYLNGTRDMALKIGMPLEPDGSIVLRAYIDAAYSVHQDMKSHSGAVFTLGSGSLLPCSTKQSCVSKSSTEAELIAYTDYIGEGLSLKNVAQDIIGAPVKLLVLQDNSSVISILKNGRLSGKSKHASKHVKVRVAWIKERQDEGDFATAYCPTELMISDGLTKPKSAAGHLEFRNMLGVGPSSLPPKLSKERAGNAGNPTQTVRTITKAPGSVPRCERETSLVSNDADEDSMNKDSSNQDVKM